MNRKSRRAASKAGSGTGAPGSLVDHLFASAAGNHRAGQLAAAEAQYRQVLSIEPRHSYGLYYLGVIALQQGHSAAAVDLLKKAIAFNSAEVEWNFDLGLAHQFLGQWTESTSHYRRVIAAKPDHVEAQTNLGMICMTEGRIGEAMAHCQRALAVNPNYVPAHNCLGNMLAGSGKLDEAAAVFQRITELSPQYVVAYENLARTYLMRGRALEGLPVLMRGLRIAATPALQNLFVSCVQGLRASEFDANLHILLVRAISENWGRASELAGVCISLIKKTGIADCIARAVTSWPKRLSADELFGPAGLTTVAQEPLLLQLLVSTYVTDVDLERFLSLVRSAFLDLTLRQVRIGERELAFFAALAQQCFINEFVFAATDDEIARARGLWDRLVVAMETAAPVPESWPVAAVMYFPLRSMSQAKLLLQKSWPGCIHALLVHLIQEPAEELALRVTIPQLTPIDDRVSRVVRDQYEENPYPRWIKLLPVKPRASLDEHLRIYFPLAPHRSLGKGYRIDILIAGCGTGQTTVELAQQFPKSQLLAVDLSLASLAYAKRKTLEAGLSNIEYAQADILRLSDIGRSFDFIEASGVLHHMAEPFAGWEALLSALRPNGFMSIGLYSELARQDVVVARALITQKGYQPNAADIRRFREEIMALDDGLPLKGIVRGEFFSLSGIRDWLFHVHERRFTLPQIQEFLDRNRLQLLGFNVPDQIASRYRAQFPDDKAMVNLQLWHEFEQENPQAFHGMYQFWIQRES